MSLNFFGVKFIEKLSNGLIYIHLIGPPNYFEFWDKRIKNPFVWKKFKFRRENVVQRFYTGQVVVLWLEKKRKFGCENVVHSGCTGLCVTEQ